MEYWERQEAESLQKAFIKALQENPPNFEKAKQLLAQGVDINAADAYRSSILEDCLLNLSSFPPECDYCENGCCKTCEDQRRPQLIPIIDFFIENGWDTVAYGLNCIASLVHTTHDAQMFYAAKRILACPLSDSSEEFETALESIGTEESFQRCCEECHEEENLYYAMYEIVDAKMNGKPFEGIHPYYRALGKKIDKILYFAEKTDFLETPCGVEFGGDFGFVCGDEVVAVRSSINVLLMNDRIAEQPQTDISDIFGDGVVGATIVDISFAHQTKSREKTYYGQPAVIIRLDSGKDLRFTHNFGELPDGATQARFLTTELSQAIADQASGLFRLCAQKDIDLDKIEAYIVGTAMSADDITKTAIRLADEFAWEVDAFKAENDREPKADELISSNWLSLFGLFLQYGLDPNAVYCDDGSDRDNLLQHLTWLDNRDMVYKLFRLLLKNGADPNLVIDDEGLFEKIDGDVVMDATLMEIEGRDKIPYEILFRLWLLLMAYGGHRDDWGRVLELKDGYNLDMFANCEAFSYRKEVTEDDWYLHIYITKTGEEVAVL